MTSRVYKYLSRFIVIMLLSGCTPPPSAIAPLNKTISLHERKLSINQLTHFNIKGGLAVKEQNKGFTATMNWRQSSRQNFHIHLFGPLGSGNVHIRGRQGLVTLQDGKKKASAHSAEELLFKQTGHHLPLGGMYYWLRGLPSPNAPFTSEYDKYQHLSKLRQNGWTIDYPRYTAFQGVDLPSKITMIKGAIKVKVIINRWRQ